MSRVDDVIHNYLNSHGITDPIHCGLIDEISKAVRYGFEQGESFGRYERYAEKVEAENLIQPENDRAWREQLEEIKRDTDMHDLIKQTELLELIAEMILYRRNGG